MTVTPHPKDSNGTAMAAKVTNLTTTVATLGNGPTKVFATDELRRSQTQLVDYYMSIGRLDPGAILSTMT